MADRHLCSTSSAALDAVGPTAAVRGVRADAGIAANVVAAVPHDRIFVPEARAEAALAGLEVLARSS